MRQAIETIDQAWVRQQQQQPQQQQPQPQQPQQPQQRQPFRNNNDISIANDGSEERGEGNGNGDDIVDGGEGDSGEKGDSGSGGEGREGVLSSSLSLRSQTTHPIQLPSKVHTPYHTLSNTPYHTP